MTKPLRADGLDPTPVQIEFMLALKELGYKTKPPRLLWPCCSICMARHTKGQYDVMRVEPERVEYLGRLERLPE